MFFKKCPSFGRKFPQNGQNIRKTESFQVLFTISGSFKSNVWASLQKLGLNVSYD